MEGIEGMEAVPAELEQPICKRYRTIGPQLIEIRAQLKKLKV